MGSKQLELTPTILLEKLKSYFETIDDENPANKFDFADFLNYPSWEYIKDDITKQGKEGERALAQVESQINRWLIKWVARAKGQNAVGQRTKLCEMLGMGVKNNTTPMVSVNVLNADSEISNRIR